MRTASTHRAAPTIFVIPVRCRPLRFLGLALLGMFLVRCTGSIPDGVSESHDTIRVATFNIALSSQDTTEVLRDLQRGSQRICNIAEIIQIMKPDILFVQELEYDAGGTRMNLFRTKFLEKGQRGHDGIYYPYYYHFPTNAGHRSGFDLDHDGSTDGPYDAHGWGTFPDQFANAIFSKYPIDVEEIRTFKNLKWSDLPDPHRPVDPATGAYYWTDQEWRSIYLSSKNHVDIPVLVHQDTLHLLGLHAQSGLGDGPEHRNSLKNYDEIKFFSDYLRGYPFTDDQGRRRTFDRRHPFVVAGDFNSDPIWNGDLSGFSILQLLNNPLLNQEVAWGDKVPSSGNPATLHNPEAPPATPYATRLRSSGRMERIDYVLPSAGLGAAAAGVFWPRHTEAGFELVNERDAGSDHRLVYVDLILPAANTTKEF